ncbi:uncharacterized protein LOC134855460 [Symsagittifera roscoffensis]|uniref:uncharacterized protein LOC134855460 n=1 Tax=Symsagittifera roscoffensis TaxID=84072 RepID=UPI00307C35E1
MSYCGKKNIQNTVMYNGIVLHSLNRVDRLSQSANVNRSKTLQDVYVQTTRSPRNAQQQTYESDDEYEYYDLPDLKMNDRLYFKGVTENQKKVIGDNLRLKEKTLTPAKWRMKTVEDKLRHSWGRRDLPSHEWTGFNKGDRKLSAVKRSKSMLDVRRSQPNRPSRSALQADLKFAHRVLPNEFVISPEWNSEFVHKGKPRPGESFVKAIIPQRDFSVN